MIPKTDAIRRAVMGALDKHRGALDQDVPLTRIDITIFLNARTQQPQDIELRTTHRQEVQRQSVKDADAGSVADARLAMQPR